MWPGTGTGLNAGKVILKTGTATVFDRAYKLPDYADYGATYPASSYTVNYNILPLKPATSTAANPTGGSGDVAVITKSFSQKVLLDSQARRFKLHENGKLVSTSKINYKTDKATVSATDRSFRLKSIYRPYGSSSTQSTGIKPAVIAANTGLSGSSGLLEFVLI